MKRILALFLHPIFLGLLTLVILGLAVWFGGEYIRIGDSEEPVSVVTRLIVIMIFVLLLLQRILQLIHLYQHYFLSSLFILFIFKTVRHHLKVQTHLRQLENYLKKFHH